MKVGTDGVLLGAWANCNHCRSILDVGAGTGLIALMIAQRNQQCSVTAIEIDPPAALQALENVNASPWHGRIEVMEADLKLWVPSDRRKFDLIVCNPPFFAKSLKNPDVQRSKARHDDDLPLIILIPKASELLTPDGRVAMILPVERLNEALEIAAACGLVNIRRTNVRGNPGTAIRRVLLEWGRHGTPSETGELVIETESRGIYTTEYQQLTKDFYL